MEVTFDVYDAEERAIVMRAAEELDALYESRRKSEDAKYDGAQVDEAMPYIPPAVSDMLSPISDAPPVENFVEEFRKQAQRIGPPAALGILREQFGVNRATEVPEAQQSNLIGAMLVQPALNA